MRLFKLYYFLICEFFFNKKTLEEVIVITYVFLKKYFSRMVFYLKIY
jgi:hypothetical protein